jgi:hypothetical protein
MEEQIRANISFALCPFFVTGPILCRSGELSSNPFRPFLVTVESIYASRSVSALCCNGCSFMIGTIQENPKLTTEPSYALAIRPVFVTQSRHKKEGHL